MRPSLKLAAVMHRLVLPGALSAMGVGAASAQCGGRWIVEGQGNLAGSTQMLSVREWDADGDGPAPSELFYGTGGGEVWAWDGVRRRSIATGQNAGGLPIFALAPFQGRLFAGGEFTRIGGINAAGIAQHDGAAWSTVGPGQLTVTRVTSMAVYRGELYAGGVLRVGASGPYGNIARWDGQTWTGLGAGVNNFVYSLCEHDGLLYVGGAFSQAGGQPRQSLATWDGSAWASVPGVSLLSGANVGCLLSTPEGLVIGGGLGRLNGTAVRGIVRWRDGACGQIGDGVDFLVTSVATWRGELYAGGPRSASPQHRIARWNGVEWLPLAGGFGDLANGPSCMSGFGERLVVGGDLDVRDLGLRAFAAMWDGQRWGRFGSGFDARVRAVLSTPDGLLAGGDFLMYDDTACRGAARWLGDRWVQLGTLQGNVQTLGISRGHPVASGSVPGSIVQWTGDAWAPLGAGLSSPATAMVEFEGDLIVGGGFSSAGGAPAPFIARWDGAQWSRMGTRIVSSVQRLAVVSGELYAGIGAGGAPYLFRWDGSDWDPLTPGPSVPVLAMRTIGGELLVAGTMSIPGLPATNVYAWNGAAWRALPAGTYGAVAMAEYGGDLVLGGPFNTAGGASTTGVARLNGAGWSPFAPEFTGSVESLTVRGPELVAAGSFDELGGTARIARWTPDGIPWFTQGPADQAVTVGGAAILRASPASGYVDAASATQWQQQDGSVPGGWSNLIDGPLIRDGVVLGQVEGTSSASLTVVASRAFSALAFRCVVSNTCGSSASESSSITASAAPCAPDFNADGFLDFFDYLDFVSCFEGQGCASPDPLAADFNADGFVDFFDYGDFVDAFAAGC